MAKPTLSEISKLFKTDDKPTDFHYYGTVVSADVENRTYEVSINRDENITVEAARLVGAHVGDTVMVTVMANGYATVTGRVGGDTDASDAQRKADSASTIADQAQTKAVSALGKATEAEQLANQAKQLADQAERNASRSADAAYNSEQSAQESAESAARSATAADTAERNAASSKTASETAQQNAANSQTAAEAARDRAISAEGYAQQANTYAQQANTHAGEALVSAGKANEAANAAVNSVSIVEDVAGTLQWIQDHGTYAVTADTTVQNGKVYFIYNSTTQDYEPIATPDTTKNPHAEGWYELDISDSQTEYIMAHLAVTSQGLWVLPSGLGQDQSERYAPGWKLLLANDGAYVYDNNGVLTAKYSSNIEFDTSREHKIGNANQYIRYYNKNGQYKIDIVADSITLGGSNVATTLSNLAAADTDQTNALNAYKTSNDAAVSANATGLANYIASNNSVIESLERQIDGAIDTWYYSGVPTLNNDPAKNWPANTYESHERDLYFDTSTGHTYRFARIGNAEPYTYEWIEIQDADALRALQAAAAAQDTADNKRRVFTVSSNDHPVPPYDVGDLWVQGQNGDILRCVQTRLDPQVWASTDWQPASKYTDDSAVTALAGNVYTKSEVYTKQNIDTKIGEINTTIASKETTIKQYADDKANAAEQAAIDDAASKYYTKTQTYTKSEITQRAEEISLQVTENKISQITYDEDNLLINADDLTKWTTENGISVEWDDEVGMYKITDRTHTSSRWGLFQDLDCSPNTYYTFSMDGMYIEGDGASMLAIDSYETTASWPGMKKAFSTERSRKTYTWKTGASHSKIRVYICHNATRAGSYFYAVRPKLSINATENAKAEIKVTTDAIESTVSNKVGNDEVISKIRQSAETVKIKANQVEIDGAATFSAIKSQADAEYDRIGSASTAETNAKTYADGKASTAESNAKTYADGKASTAESNAKSYADGKASTAESNAKSYVDANYTANTAAMSRTQRIYYRSDSSTLPNPPTENNKGKWFEPTQNDTGYNTWSRDIVPLIGGFHYLFMCDQTQTAAQYVAGNECTNSSVMRDDSTSVIDGGSITTGRINANYIDASTLQIGYGQVDGLGEFMSLMTFKDGVLRIAKPGSRFAVELSDDGLFFKQNDTAVSYINMNRLYIPYAVVLDQMMIGKEENNSLWAWTSEEDGSLTLKWIGGNN